MPAEILLGSRALGWRRGRMVLFWQLFLPVKAPCSVRMCDCLMLGILHSYNFAYRPFAGLQKGIRPNSHTDKPSPATVGEGMRVGQVTRPTVYQVIEEGRRWILIAASCVFAGSIALDYVGVRDLPCCAGYRVSYRLNVGFMAGVRRGSIPFYGKNGSRSNLQYKVSASRFRKRGRD